MPCQSTEPLEDKLWASIMDGRLCQSSNDFCQQQDFKESSRWEPGSSQTMHLSALLRAHREAVTNTQSILCSAVTWLLGLREFIFHACCCYHNQAPQSILSTEAAAPPQENETLELGKAASKFSSFFYIMLNVSKCLTPKYVNKHSTSFCLSGKINANFPPGGQREEVCVSWVNRIWCFRR